MGWNAKFKLSWSILENSIKDTDETISETRINEIGSKFLTGFSLSIPPSSADEAFRIAIEKGNRVADYLGSIHHLPVQADLCNITEIKPKGETKIGIASVKISGNIHQPVDLDFANIKKLLVHDDPKIPRQLAHYNSGLRSSDPINQFREFYLVLEDEYSKNNPSYLEKYRFIRHALNHPELNKPIKQKLWDEIRAFHIDPSSPDAQKLVEENLRNLKDDARLIINEILKTI